MNTYENAYVGVKRLRTGVILRLIASILSIVVVIFSGITIALAANPDLFGSAESIVGVIAAVGIFTIVSLVLSVIAYILMLMGLSRAGLDNNKFKTALIWVIISLIITIVINLFPTILPAGLVTGLDTIVSITDLIVIILVTSGCSEILPELAGRARTIQIILLIPVIISAVTKIASSALASNMVVFGVLSVISVIATLVYFFMYLSFLGKAKKLLSR